jgi:hypothetical protein
VKLFRLRAPLLIVEAVEAAVKLTDKPARPAPESASSVPPGAWTVVLSDSGVPVLRQEPVRMQAPAEVLDAKERRTRWGPGPGRNW